jgi:PKD repeat protein/glucose/arabinose dehydrogenase
MHGSPREGAVHFPGGHISARLVTWALAACLLLATSATAQAATLPAGFAEETLGAGLTAPVGAATAPDGRIFVAEKGGRVRVITPDRLTLAAPLLDISGRVNSYHDRGLLGIAVDRDFATNGYLYLLYTYDVAPLTADSSTATVAQLLRVTVSANNTASNETVLLGSYTSGACPTASNTLDCLPSNGASHSIGTVRVDPSDGTLWVGLGDSSSFTQVDNLAFRTYDEQSFAGKIIHVDRAGRGLPGHPFCPADADLTHVCTKLYAKGFRNPYRFHLRPDGPLVAGDVQWDANEELDIVRPGGNYGWPCWEARGQTPGYSSDQRCASLYAAGGDTKPLHHYPHVDGSGNNSSAIVGGPEYNGTDFPPEYRSSIFYGDYAKGVIRRVRVDASDNCVDPNPQGGCGALPFATDWFGGVDLQAAPGGGLLYVEFGDGGPTGSVKRIFWDTLSGRPVAKIAASPRSGPAPLNVQFSSAGSSDPNGDSLSYQWDFGDGSTSTAQNPSHTYTSAGTFTARLTVSDGTQSNSASLTITPGNSAPTVNITAPVQDSAYRAGQTIELRGNASDPEDGALTGTSLSWRITLVHGSHDHPLSERTGTSASFVAASDHDSDSFYRITLRATDSAGLDSERIVTIRPETVPFVLKSSPEPGAEVSYGGISATTPYARQSAIGYETSVSAQETYTRLGRTWVFDSWSDGGARLHNITIPASASSLTASYREDKAANRPADASSSGPGLGPELANDVSSTTRWSSAYADNQWWQVDLGTARKVDTVELNWEAAYASQYKIQVSTDNVSFTDVATVNLTSKRLERTTFAATTARYVRVLGVTRATRWGFSFYDARVMGPDDAVPPPAEDKALGRPASASSVYKSFESRLANDGDSTTRWSSVFSDGQWWQVDLGSVRKVDTVEINWEAAYPRSYRIQTSTDGTTFSDAATVAISNPGWKKTTFTARDARYVRVLSVTRATGYGISIWDARVFGPDDPAQPPPPPPPTPQEKAAGGTATASSTEAAGREPPMAIDGVSTTRWASARIDNQWWQVDLGRARKVDAVEINWEAAYARQYRIQTSTDGTTFTDAATVNITARGLKRTEFAERSARYVRVLGVTRATVYGISFWDLRVFGVPD